jgi:hypothetical protein
LPTIAPIGVARPWAFCILPLRDTDVETTADVPGLEELDGDAGNAVFAARVVERWLNRETATHYRAMAKRAEEEAASAFLSGQDALAAAFRSAARDLALGKYARPDGHPLQWLLEFVNRVGSPPLQDTPAHVLASEIRIPVTVVETARSASSFSVAPFLREDTERRVVEWLCKGASA